MSNAFFSEEVLASVAELFSLLSTPIRLKVIRCLCDGEKNVSQMLAEIDTTQPNLSQHLSTLYRAGVLGRRREGTQVFYRLQNERVSSLCRAVCEQASLELNSPTQVPDSQRLLRRAVH